MKDLPRALDMVVQQQILQAPSAIRDRGDGSALPAFLLFSCVHLVVVQAASVLARTVESSKLYSHSCAAHDAEVS